MICMFKEIHYCWLMHLRTLEIRVLAWPADFKKTKVKLDLLTDIGMLLMIEKGIRGRICHSIY